MSVAEIKDEVSRLSKAERLQAMEWHGQVLAARQAKVDSGEGEFLSVAQLKKRRRR